jgi:hypothetical protein
MPGGSRGRGRCARRLPRSAQRVDERGTSRGSGNVAASCRRSA